MLARKLIKGFAGEQSAGGGGQYRYWRIYVQTNGGSNNICICEIELRGSVGGSDLTTPSTPATASSSEFGYGPEKMIDNNNITTSWYTSAGAIADQWARFDMVSAVYVAQVTIMPTASAYSAAPKDFKIQGSNDGTNFTDVKAFTNVTGWAYNTLKTFNL